MAAPINDLPTELLLNIESHLDHPVLYEGNALACTCLPMWDKLGGSGVYRRAAKAERDLSLATRERLRLMVKDRWRESENLEHLAWVRDVARRGMGPRTVDGVLGAFQFCRPEALQDENGDTIWVENNLGFPTRACRRYTLDEVTRKTLLNRATMRCQDMTKLEAIVDAYVDVFPDIFTGACTRTLLELLPIHAAVKAKRPQVVQILINKGLAPALVDKVISTSGRVEVEWEDEYDKFDSNPFNLALSKKQEEDHLTREKRQMSLMTLTCPTLTRTLSDSGSDSDDFGYDLDDSDDEEERPLDAEIATYLKIAEACGMYRLIPALLQYWNRTCPAHLYSLRRLLDLVSHQDGRTDILYSGRESIALGADGKPRVIEELLKLRADCEPGHEDKRGALAHTCQARAGRVDRDELEAVLRSAARHQYTGESFFLNVWPDCRELLYQEGGDGTTAAEAEANKQRVDQCMQKILEDSIKVRTGDQGLIMAEPQLHSQKAALHLVRNGVQPDLRHFQKAIKAWDLDLCREIIARGEFDLRAKWSGFRLTSSSDEPKDDYHDESSDYDSDDEEDEDDKNENENENEEKAEINAFEYALLLWHKWHPATLPKEDEPLCPTLLCELLYHAGTPAQFHDPAAVCLAIQRVVSVFFVQTSDPEWVKRGQQIHLGAAELKNGYREDLLVDPSASLLVKLTTLCLVLQKQFKLAF
ncbi:hypothetical protein PGQ11_010602 [Apiospora arundinis]|uniref:F-box domain-containing protein n=1 Tax=Apiospora arundinis TaxID=335852 RepID=A0ABR2IA58_9PEZI